MRKYVLLVLVLGCFLGMASAQEHRRYALIWHDEFDGEALDNAVWSKIWRGRADWMIHMSSNERLYAMDNGDLVLRGMVNDFMPKDTAAFLTGGVWSRNRKAFGFGRVEVRAKFDVAQGFWPAIWMLPQVNQSIDWPYGGEIDIMEHFRDNPFVNQTVHSHYTVHLRRRNRPSQVVYPKYNEGQYNTYGMERFHDSLVFFVNGRRTHCYPRYRNGINGQFPFDLQDYYLILDAQLGRDRSPYIDTAKMPVELRVDYVRYYEVDTKTDVIPEPKEYHQYTKRRYKYKKMTVDTKETFDNADAYHIITKRGRAVVSGNVVWAQSTLAQLVGEDGKIANVDFYDQAICPCRGISLDKYSKKLTFDELTRLLDVMAFYKLNYLQWNGNCGCSEEEANALKEQARGLGIAMVAEIPSSSNVDLLEVEGKKLSLSSSRVFLQNASKNGGWLFLKGVESEDMDAMMSFSERYWRGGDAGEGTVDNGLPDAFSTAGTRMANFKEKLAVHRERFHF